MRGITRFVLSIVLLVLSLTLRSEILKQNDFNRSAEFATVVSDVENDDVVVESYKENFGSESDWDTVIAEINESSDSEPVQQFGEILKSLKIKMERPQIMVSKPWIPFSSYEFRICGIQRTKDGVSLVASPVISLKSLEEIDPDNIEVTEIVSTSSELHGLNGSIDKSIELVATTTNGCCYKATELLMATQFGRVSSSLVLSPDEIINWGYSKLPWELEQYFESLDLRFIGSTYSPEMGVEWIVLNGKGLLGRVTQDLESEDGFRTVN